MLSRVTRPTSVQPFVPLVSACGATPGTVAVTYSSSNRFVQGAISDAAAALRRPTSAHPVGEFAPAFSLANHTSNVSVPIGHSTSTHEAATNNNVVSHWRFYCCCCLAAHCSLGLPFGSSTVLTRHLSFPFSLVSPVERLEKSSFEVPQYRGKNVQKPVYCQCRECRP